MRSKTSAIRVRNANPVATRLWRVNVAAHATPPGPWLQKKLQDSERILQLNFCGIQLRLVFDYHTLDGAMLNWARVINTNSLAGSQRSCHSFARRVDNVRGGAQSETYRALLAPDDDRLTRLVGCYRAGLVSCARSRFCCGCWS